jgi:hypothetical protein
MNGRRAVLSTTRRSWQAREQQAKPPSFIARKLAAYDDAEHRPSIDWSWIGCTEKEATEMVSDREQRKQLCRKTKADITRLRALEFNVACLETLCSVDVAPQHIEALSNKIAAAANSCQCLCHEFVRPKYVRKRPDKHKRGLGGVKDRKFRPTLVTRLTAIGRTLSSLQLHMRTMIRSKGSKQLQSSLWPGDYGEFDDFFSTVLYPKKTEGTKHGSATGRLSSRLSTLRTSASISYIVSNQSVSRESKGGDLKTTDHKEAEEASVPNNVKKNPALFVFCPGAQRSTFSALDTAQFYRSKNLSRKLSPSSSRKANRIHVGNGNGP